MPPITISQEHVPNFVEFECGAPNDSFGKLLLDKQILRKEQTQWNYIMLERKRGYQSIRLN